MRLLSEWVVSLAVLCVMKVCAAMTFNAVRNIRMTDYVWDNAIHQCVYQPQAEGFIYIYIIPVYLVEFFLPALGGLLVDKWSSELKVLRVAGILLFLSGLYVAVIDHLKLMCQPVAFMFGFVPICLANGVGLAPLIAAPLKLSEGHLGSPTPGLLAYYASASFGELLGFVPRYIRSIIDLTWVVCVFPMVYISLSFMLKLDWTEFRQRFYYELDDGFTFPTNTRLRRYFLLLVPLVLLVCIFASVRGATYCLEMDYYLNCTENCTQVTCKEVFGGYNIATIATTILLGVLYKLGCVAHDGSIFRRFYIGSSVLLVSKSAFIAWHVWAASLSQLPAAGTVYMVYAIASGLDGVSNGLALAAGYEMLYRTAPANSKSLVMGLLFTMWATGTSLAGVTIYMSSKVPFPNALLKPVLGISNKLYTLYIIMAIESVLMVLYFFCFNSRVVPTMIIVSDSPEEGPNSAFEFQAGVDEDDETSESAILI